MTLVAEISLIADAFVLSVIAAFAFYGWQQGLFITTIAALQVLAAAFAALALAADLSPLLESVGVGADTSLPSAYLAIFAGAMLAGRLAVGAFVPRDAIAFARAIDTYVSAVVGGVAGLVLAGTLLSGWSMVPLPRWARLHADDMRIDAGSRFLDAFTRCVLPAGPGRRILLDGEDMADTSDDAAFCSEPFVDANRNGSFDDGERYLDLDRDGRFSPQRPYVDVNDNGRRDFGLRECYRLAAWRNLAVLHTPRITSPAVADRKRTDESTNVIYQATASDAEPGDTLTFRLKPDAGDDAAGLLIEPTSGLVECIETPDPSARKTYRFTVVVTDRHGLQAERAVSVSISPARR